MLVHSVFEHLQPIPIVYTCKGKNVSPPLQFLAVPKEAKSLVLIVDDPDAPHGTFDHWIVWNISPSINSLSEGAPELYKTSHPAIFGVNGYGKNDYKGPCPPPGGLHHYHFKLYALDIMLTLREGAIKQEVEEMMQNHIIQQSELIGVFSSDMI